MQQQMIIIMVTMKIMMLLLVRLSIKSQLVQIVKAQKDQMLALEL